MSKKIALATLAVFVAWSIMDFVIHGILLEDAYQRTASLWRPIAEMKWGLMYFVTLVYSFVFVYIFTRFFARRSLATGVWYGLLFGIGVGVSMGYGSYAYMPIPYGLALAWFLGTLAEALVAGALTGWIAGDRGGPA